MSQADERRELLRTFVSAKGGHAAVVRAYRLTPSQASYLSQIVTPESTASFGETAAKNWEERLKLPKYSLVKPGSADLVAFVTGKSVDELAGSAKHNGTKTINDADNVRLVEIRRTVPVISWVQAGRWAEIQDNFQAGEADDWVAPLHSKPSSKAYGLIVEGDSMTNPNPEGVSFPHGTLIIADPDQAFDAGSFVIAKDVQTQMATFKKLTTDGGRWYLKPLNPAYNTIEIDDPAIRVIAKVCEFQLPGGKL